MQKFDLAVGWIWEYDESFVKLLEHEIHRKYGLQTFRVTEENVNEVLELVRSDSLRFSTYLDRAFDEELIFQELGEAVKLRGGKVMNDYAETSSAIDKATMHLEFMRGGIRVPYTIIISPFSKANEIELTLADMAHLGRPFIIKPANTTGGGIGVVTGAETLLDVLEARQDFADDKYLLQEKIIPRIIKDKRCWYRCYFVYGQVYLVRWDDLTHEYDLITPDEEHFYKLRPLRGIETYRRDLWP
jgi:glutathione synthase/RimK-type ligase-like ATP-grasp enzyme